MKTKTNAHLSAHFKSLSRAQLSARLTFSQKEVSIHFVCTVIKIMSGAQINAHFSKSERHSHMVCLARKKKSLG